MTYEPDPFAGVMVAGATQRAFRELNEYPMQDNGHRVRVSDASIKAGPRCLEVGASGFYMGNCDLAGAAETVAFYAQAAGLKVKLEPVGHVTYEEDPRKDLTWAKRVYRVGEAEDWIPAVASWREEEVGGGIQLFV